MNYPSEQTAAPVRVLVTGANGFGGMVAAAVKERGWDVVATTRNEATRARALAVGVDAEEIVCIDFIDPVARTADFWEEFLAEQRIDAVINCAMRTPKSVPRADLDPAGAHLVNCVVPQAIAVACEGLDVAFVQLSALDAHRADRGDAYRRSKDRFRAWLQRWTRDTSLRSVIAEMGIVAYPGRGHYPLELICSLPVATVTTSDVGLNPIDARDAAAGLVGLAEALVDGDTSRVQPGEVIKVAGPETVRWAAYFGRIRAALGLGDKRWLRIPVPCNRFSAAVVELARRLSIPLPADADGFDILELDRDFAVTPKDVERFRAAAGFDEFRSPVAAYEEWRSAGNEVAGVADTLRSLFGGSRREYEPMPLPVARLVRQRVLVFGATGFMGPTIVEELVREGHVVVAAVRDPEKGRRQLDLPGVEIVRVDLEDDWPAARFHELIEEHGVDAVVNNAGACTSGDPELVERVNHRTPLALVEAADRIGRRRRLRFIQVSSTGVYWDDWAEISYTRSKRLLDEEIERREHLDWVIVRPNMVLEPGRGHVPLEDVARLPVLPYLRDEPIQPIDNRELAIGIARLVRSSVTRVILDASGPDIMSWPELMNTVRAAMGRQRAPCAKVPGVGGARAVIAGLHRVFGGQAFAKLASLDDETFRVAGRGSVRDSRAWTEATGVAPWHLGDSWQAWFAGPAAYRIYVERGRHTPVSHPMGSSNSTSARSNVGS